MPIMLVIERAGWPLVQHHATV